MLMCMFLIFHFAFAILIYSFLFPNFCARKITAILEGLFVVWCSFDVFHYFNVVGLNIVTLSICTIELSHVCICVPTKKMSVFYAFPNALLFSFMYVIQGGKKHRSSLKAIFLVATRTNKVYGFCLF